MSHTPKSSIEVASHAKAAKRLDSWKEIASYLDRSVRTVRRWEEKEGLPVHRHQHDKGSTVFAHRNELEAWLDQRRAEPTVSPAAAESAVEAPPTVTEGVKASRMPVFAFAAIALLLFAGLAWWVRGWENPFGLGAQADADAPMWVLITQFENRTGNDLFEGLVEYALEREVSNSEHLRVVPKKRIADTLSLMRRPASTAIDGELGREICQRDTQINGLVTGRVETLGSDYLLSVDLVNPLQGSTVVNLSRQFTEGQHLLPTLHQLARDVREALSRTLPALVEEAKPAPARVTTASLEALELFSRAERLIENDSPAPAAVLLRQAIELDPIFASAQIQLSWLEQQSTTTVEQSLERARTANSMVQGLSATERFFIQGSFAHQQGDYADADASYRALLSLEPGHYWGNTRAFEACRELGSDKNCVPYRIRLANRRPMDFRANSDAAWAIAVLAADLDKAARYVERAKNAAPARQSQAHVQQVVLTELFPVYRSWLEADFEGAEQAREKIEREFDEWSLPVQDGLARELGSLDMAFGRLQSASKWFEKISDPVARHEMQALVLFARGDMSVLSEHLGAKSGYREPMTAVLLSMTGHTAAAEALINHLETQEQGAAYSEVSQGQLAMMQGEFDEAISLLSAGAGKMSLPAQAMYFAALDMKASALEKSGKVREAIEALEMTTELRTQSAFAGTGLFWTKCQFHLVQLYRASEQTKEAKMLEVELRQKLSNADSDYPVHAELLTREKSRPQAGAV